MTDVAQVIGAVAVLLSVALNFYFGVGERQRLRRERDLEAREWYKQTLFQRRLDAVHSAFAWLMKLNRLMNQLSPDRAVIQTTQQEAREWYDLNVFYLDDIGSGSHFVGACNSHDQQDFGPHMNAYFDTLKKRAQNLMSLESPTHG